MISTGEIISGCTAWHVRAIGFKATEQTSNENLGHSLQNNKDGIRETRALRFFHGLISHILLPSN